MSELPFSPFYRKPVVKQPKTPTLKKAPVAKPVAPTVPQVDLTNVPANLMFMTTEGFKDAANVFYRDLSFVQPTSDRGWVKRRFVDGLDTWPHIKRADDALNGLISKAFTIVAENPHFPPWWRSIGVCLLRGNPVNLIRQCETVLAYKGVHKQIFESDIVDKNFDDRRDVRLNVVSEEALLIEVECPPSLPLELWDRISVEMREEALIEMALGLRSGVHPIGTVEKLLDLGNRS
jgi:hypothetical protein